MLTSVANEGFWVAQRLTTTFFVNVNAVLECLEVFQAVKTLATCDCLLLKAIVI